MQQRDLALAVEDAVFEDGEAALVEGEVAGVADPEGAGDGAEAVVVPDRDALGLDGGLEDGDDGGLVAMDGDGLGELVLEEIAERNGGGYRRGGDGDRGGLFVFGGGRGGRRGDGCFGDGGDLGDEAAADGGCIDGD
jgi:hypothetical protein